jgi:hypothetical protein
VNIELSNAKRTARRWAKSNGHHLDKWSIEAGRPVAVCSCGAYAFVERQGRHYVYGSGRLPVPGSVRIEHRCPATGQPVQPSLTNWSKQS